jgi:hypothetical protein
VCDDEARLAILGELYDDKATSDKRHRQRAAAVAAA